ncbi:DUF3800 domain-containing protein [Flavobacterium sp. B183]|uniref:DUF3800 domain-containing protein n=1 Tax=Flavobacterium sp. B183 TaxID=907046 RepID=UPI00201F91EA|nr:DUF3800 domain-containing protein [Flavobacterium sp. B183]URC11545.1 hypothetical protein M4I44_15745 [Flavobacterium sp. B183]
MDFTTLREKTIKFGGLYGVDDSYTFYYDETNNIRKFYVREHNFNESVKKNFVVGGLCYDKTKFNLGDLFNKLNLPSNVEEIKLKHIAKGNFLECLTSKKLRLFLEGIQKSDLYLHYSTLNFLYFSIVDIVDSIDSGDDQNFIMSNRIIKDALYQIIELDRTEFIKLFYKYGYPNIKASDLIEFVKDFIFLIESTKEEKLLHQLNNLKDYLLDSADKGRLIFLTDETDHMLIEDFVHFYARPMYLFKNSRHIFDMEKTVAPLTEELMMEIDGTKLDNYSFIDSKNNLYIQASDIIVGLLGKYFDYLVENSLEKIRQTLINLDDISYSNLELFAEIIDKTDRKNKAFIHKVVADSEMEKDQYILDYFFN